MSHVPVVAGTGEVFKASRVLMLHAFAWQDAQPLGSYSQLDEDTPGAQKDSVSSRNEPFSTRKGAGEVEQVGAWAPKETLEPQPAF